MSAFNVNRPIPHRIHLLWLIPVVATQLVWRATITGVMPKTNGYIPPGSKALIPRIKRMIGNGR